MSESTSPKRDFMLNKDVTASSLETIILGIHEANKYDDEKSAEKVNFVRKPIKIIIDSYGGECYSGMALVNTIDTSKTPVHTYCYGKAMSMGLTLFAAGHKRFAHRLATFMQHQLTGGGRAKLVDLADSLDEKMKLQEMLDDFLVERTEIEKETIMKFRETKTDWYFNGQEAFEYGVVDELLESRVR